jgi:hypothetical protein
VPLPPVRRTCFPPHAAHAGESAAGLAPCWREVLFATTTTTTAGSGSVVFAAAADSAASACAASQCAVAASSFCESRRLSTMTDSMSEPCSFEAAAKQYFYKKYIRIAGKSPQRCHCTLVVVNFDHIKVREFFD